MAHPVSVVGGAHKAKKQGRSSETTPKTASKRQQLLATKAIGWKETETSQLAKEKSIRKWQEDKGTPTKTPAKPLKIILRRQGQQEPYPLTKKINLGTQEEETEEEPSEHLQRRQKKSMVDHAGEQSGLEKERTPIPRTEGPEPRVESELVRTKPVTECPAQQDIPAGQDTARPVVQEPVIQLPPSPTHQEQLEPEWPTETQLEPERQSCHAPETELQIDATRQDRPLVTENSSQPSV